MADRFKVGEICELTDVDGPLEEGAEVEIVKPLRKRKFFDHGDDQTLQYEPVYVVNVAGQEWLVRPDQLRRKPPTNPLRVVEWASCPWRPRETQP